MTKNYCEVCGVEEGKPHGIVVCAYCGVELPCAEMSTIPDVSDGEAWDELELKHNTGCEWVATRSHRTAQAAER